MEILNHNKIVQKINRIAIQILENNYDESEIYLIGLNNSGMRFAELLLNVLKAESDIIFHLVKLTTKTPEEGQLPAPLLDADISTFTNKTLILIDDVANTGKTTFYAFTPLMAAKPKKLEVAVLVDRKHKQFPVKTDYVGLSLATTLQENIDVNLSKENAFSAILE